MVVSRLVQPETWYFDLDRIFILNVYLEFDYEFDREHTNWIGVNITKGDLGLDCFIGTELALNLIGYKKRLKVFVKRI